jgi:hypothetical protein
MNSTPADRDVLLQRAQLSDSGDLGRLLDGDVELAPLVLTGTTAESFGVEGNGRSFRIDQAVITHLRDGNSTRSGWPS